MARDLTLCQLTISWQVAALRSVLEADETLAADPSSALHDALKTSPGGNNAGGGDGGGGRRGKKGKKKKKQRFVQLA